MALTKKGGKRKVCPKYCRRKTLRCKSYRKPRKMHKKRGTKKMKGGISSTTRGGCGGLGRGDGGRDRSTMRV